MPTSLNEHPACTAAPVNDEAINYGRLCHTTAASSSTLYTGTGTSSVLDVISTTSRLCREQKKETQHRGCRTLHTLFLSPFSFSSPSGRPVAATRLFVPLKTLKTNIYHLPFRRWLLRLAGRADIAARLIASLPQHPCPHRSLRRQGAVSKRASRPVWSNGQSGSARRPARRARALRPRGRPTCGRHVCWQRRDQKLRTREVDRGVRVGREQKRVNGS